MKSAGQKEWIYFFAKGKLIAFFNVSSKKTRFLRWRFFLEQKKYYLVLDTLKNTIIIAKGKNINIKNS